MHKIYLDQNYIIIETGSTIDAYPFSKTLYSNVEVGDARDSAYLVTYTTTRFITILAIDVDAGDWVDDNGVAYTTTTLVAFLRGNTGY